MPKLVPVLGLSVAKKIPISESDGDHFGRHDPLAVLVDSANTGNHASFRKLLEAVAPTVHRTVSLILGHLHPDVPDVEQECLMALRTAFSTFRGESSVTRFVRQVALRRAVSALRQRQSPTGVSVNTVRSRIRLASEKLRQRIQSESGLYENLTEGDRAAIHGTPKNEPVS